MDYILAGTVILSGVLIVFMVLVILTLIVWLFGKLMSNTTGKSSGSVKAEVPQVKAAAPQAPAKAAPVQAAQDEIPEEVIAVISAAIASTLGGSENFVIKSVRRAKETSAARSAWSMAGMQHNTAPF